MANGQRMTEQNDLSTSVVGPRLTLSGKRIDYGSF